MKVDIFVPCFVDQFSPLTGFNMVKVLEKAGCKVTYNIEQTCCGLPAFNAGKWEDAREVGEKLLNEISSDKHLVCGAASCTAMIRNSYDLLFQNSSYHNKYRQLQKKTFEFSEFLVDVLKVDNLGSKLEETAYYLPCCQATNHCNIETQPLNLLKNVEGLQLVDLNFEDGCCGFGGVFSVKNEELSVHLGKKILDKVIQAGANTIISTDYSCLLHLNSICNKDNVPIKVMHIADVLAQGI